MKIAFFGHSEMLEIEKKEIEEKLFNFLSKNIALNGQNIEFYLGDYGSFDYLAKKCCLNFKRVFINTKLFYITPYLEKLEKEEIKQELNIYNEIIYPEIERVPLRYAIIERNKWIVREVDFIIFYVNHSWGGANKMLEYASKLNKSYINLGSKTIL